MMERRRKRRKGFKVAAIMFLLGGLTACVNPLAGVLKVTANGVNEQAEIEEDGKIEIRPWEVRKIEPDIQLLEETEEEAVDEIVNEPVPLESRTVSDEYREERLNEYVSVLEGIYYHQVYPNGQECGFSSLDDRSENQFAVYDIDKDGKEELIVQITTTYTAGMCEIIYDWDEAAHTIREELLEYPALTYYDNGIIKANWSHNQGMAGEFWPYTVYQYQPETDTYKIAGEVDAWDRNLRETDYDGNVFPSELDRDGNGFIYFVRTEGDNEGVSLTVDDEGYHQWINGYLGDAQEVMLPYMKLTKENIAQAADK